MTPEWFKELERRANALKGLSTTSSSKYDEFKDWLRAELGVEPAVCFLSELSKQWTPRVGQALMGLPKLLLLLIRGSSATEASERLSALHRYINGLHVTIVLVGDEGSWEVGLIVGTSGRALYESLMNARSDSGDLPEEPFEERQPPHLSNAQIDFIELDAVERGYFIWDCLLGKGSLEFDEAIKAAAITLRDEGRVQFERLRRDGPLYAAIESAISSCVRRGVLFDRPHRGHIRAILSDAIEFKRDHWRDCVINAIGTNSDWVDRDELVRASANWAVEMYGLDMQRLRTGGRTDTALRSTINGLIRVGKLERKGGQLLRLAQGHSPIDYNDNSADTSMARNDEIAIHGSMTTRVEEIPPATALRAMVGELPGEAEAVFTQLLTTPLKPTIELRRALAEHLKEFEQAFESHEFLDLNGAEKLTRDALQLLERWPSLYLAEKHLAQAAILYFVESEEADDDFRIGGLRTDKLVMEAVKRVVLHEPATP